MIIAYFLKVIILTGTIWLIYHFFLQNLNWHQFKRTYLIGGILLALLMPMIPINVTSPIFSPIFNELSDYPEKNNSMFFDQVENDGSLNQALNKRPEAVTIKHQNTFSLIMYKALGFAYFFIITLMFVRLLHGIYFFRGLKKSGKPNKSHDIPFIIQDKVQGIFSFGNDIFIHSSYENRKEDLKIILRHEKEHINQRHFYDKILISILQCIFWFNPFVYLLRKKIELNHEFLVDDKIINHKAIDKEYYQKLLLNFSCNKVFTPQLATSFYKSDLLKRINMMNTKQKKSRQVFMLAAGSMLSLAILFFGGIKIANSQPKIGQITKSPDKPDHATDDSVTTELFNFFQSTMENATQKRTGKDGKTFTRVNFELIKNEFIKLDSIFYHMSSEQKGRTQNSYLFYRKPIKKTVISQAQLEKFKNTKVYGVWIDWKKAAPGALNKYKAEDFSWFSVSKLYGSAKQGKSYTHQLDLMTHKAYEQYLKEFWAKRYRPNQEK